MIFQTELLDITQRYVEELFDKDLSGTLTFHTLKHTKEVVAAVEVIGSKTKLSEEEMELTLVAAWLHDTGYCFAYKGHEDESIRIAREFLTVQKLGKEKIEKVVGCIDATRYPQQPKNQMEFVLCDADMYHLSTETYFEKAELLRQEWANMRESEIENKEWVEQNKSFLNNHTFFTEYAREHMTPLKDTNYEKLKDLHTNGHKADFQEELEETYNLKKKVDKAKSKDEEKAEKKKGKKDKKEKKEKKENKGRKYTKGVETMFRNTARNHLELSAIADNKANIMISINSIIISIIVTFMIRKLEENPYLTIPTIILLLVSLSTIIFAVLSTRPNITTGTFDRKDVRSKNANLLFFGNFYKMDIEDYEWGIKQLREDEEYVYDSMTRDIYYLGKVLGRKYNLLRVSYSIFMFGLVIAVLAYSFVILYFPMPD